MLKEKQSKFYQVCPRRLENMPCESCPLAMERVNAIKAEGPPDKRKIEIEQLPGCDWYVASADNHYCFWVYAQMLHGSPASEKEVCDLLLLSPSQLDKIQESALERLGRPENRGALLSLAELVSELSSNQGIDLTMYLPAEFKNAIRAVMDPTPEPADESDRVVKKKTGGNSQPMHRDGKKRDIYGLYSNKSREKQQDKRKPDGQVDTNKKKDDSKK